MGSVDARLQGFVEYPTDGKIDGADAWGLGDRIRVRAEVEAPVADGEAALSLAVLGAGSGEILPGWVLDSYQVRGGNRFDWDLGWERSTPTFWGAGIGGAHVRGFTGALGHSDSVVPHVSFGRRSGQGDVRIDAGYRTGSAREGRALDGFSAAFSWTREWRR
ncbi:MAG: hypothetical protein R3E97_09045 [Candidatus Eisenbacteria bacterium]